MADTLEITQLMRKLDEFKPADDFEAETIRRKINLAEETWNGKNDNTQSVVQKHFSRTDLLDHDVPEDFVSFAFGQ